MEKAKKEWEKTNKFEITGDFMDGENLLNILTNAYKKRMVKEIDPKAFTIIMESNEVVGEGFKQE